MVENSFQDFVLFCHIQYDQRFYYKHTPYWYKALNPRAGFGMIIFMPVSCFAAIKKNAKIAFYSFIPNSCKIIGFQPFFHYSTVLSEHYCMYTRTSGKLFGFMGLAVAAVIRNFLVLCRLQAGNVLGAL